MLIDPNDLLLFVHIVEDGSFSRAAERMNLPNSTLSRRISRLESSLGEKLLLRTTRKLTVTDFGHAVFAHAQQVAAEVDATLALTQHRQLQPSGRLRLSMPGDFSGDMLGPFLAEFVEKYPEIILDIDVSQYRVDLIGDNYDVALRIGELSDDASLAARRIATFHLGLYASPAYLARCGAPADPQDLLALKVLQLRTRSGEPDLWTLRQGEQLWQSAPGSHVYANSPGVLKQMVISGAGIGCFADHFVRDQLASGELMRVLPHWQIHSLPVWAIFPGRRLMPSRTRAFIDSLAENLARPQGGA